MRLRVGGLVAVLTTALAACGGGGDEAADEAAPASDSAPVTVIESGSAATTALPPTSAPTTSTTTIAPTPTTTSAPTTTIDPAAALAEEVEADYREGWRLANAALSDPLDNVARDSALAFRVGASREEFERTHERYRRDHLAIRENQDVAAVVLVERPAQLLAADADLTVLVVCEIDPWVVVEIGAGPGDSDAVVDDAVYSYRTEVFMRHRDGAWKIEGGNELQEWTGLTRCPE